MSDFKDITIWENRKRAKLLRTFRSLIVEYFANVEHNWRVDDVIESDRARELRPEINMQMRAAKEAVGGARLASYAFDPRHRPAMQFDFFSDIFRLREFNATEQWPIDLIDRAIGVYEADKAKAKFRTFNPFWWLWRGTTWIAKIPFLVLGAAGFNSKKIEASIAGKIVQAVFYFAQGLVGLYAAYRLFFPE